MRRDPATKEIITEIWVFEDGETWTDVEPKKLVLKKKEHLETYHCGEDMREVIDELWEEE